MNKIDTAMSYDELTDVISNDIIRENLVEHCAPNIQAAINRLGTDSPYYRFVQKMVLCSTLTNYNQTFQEILTLFCKKLADNYESLQYEPDEFTRLIMVICCDDRSFVEKWDLEAKLGFVHGTMMYLCGNNISQLKPENLSGTGTVMSIILDSAIAGYTSDQLEGILQGYTSGWVRPEWVTPYIAELINICSGLDKENLLNRINANTWEAMMQDKVQTLATTICKSSTWGVSVDPAWVRGFIWDILTIFGQFREAIDSTGYDYIACEPVGNLIRNLMDSIHNGYTLLGISDKQHMSRYMADILTMIFDIYCTGYASDGNSRKLISSVIEAYRFSGKYEDIWMEDPKFRKALELAYDKDPNFKEFKQEAELSTSPFEQCLYAYNDKAYEAALFLLPAIEAKKTEQWSYDEEEEHQQEPEENEEESEEPRKDPGYDIEAIQSTKGYDRNSKRVQDGSTKIYKAYKKYKNNEAKVDSQISKMIDSAKRAFTPDKTETIIQGKKFTPIGLLKKCLLTAGIFSWSKIGGIIYIVVSHTLSKKRTMREKREIIAQLDEEIRILEEKIDDARGDGNRQAKYALMRTKAELKNARDKIKFDTAATKTDLKTAVNYIKHPARAFDRGGRREDEQY